MRPLPTASATRAVAALLDVFDRLASDGPTEEELDRHRLRNQQEAQSPATFMSRLEHAALRGIGVGIAVGEPQEREEWAALRPADVAAAFAEALPTTLLFAPRGTATPHGFFDYPLWSPIPPRGRRYSLRSSLLDRNKNGIYVDGSSIAIRHVYGSAIIDLAKAPLVVRINEWTRGLWGEDGTYEEISAPLVRKGSEVIAAIDAAMPPERVRTDASAEARRKQVIDLLHWYSPRRRRIFMFFAALIPLLMLAGALAGVMSLPIALCIACGLAWLIAETAQTREQAAMHILRALPSDATVEAIASASFMGQSLNTGFLVLTDRHLVFVRHGAVVFAADRVDIVLTRERKVSATLLLTVGGEAIRFDELKPGKARAQIARALRGSVTVPVAQPRWASE